MTTTNGDKGVLLAIDMTNATLPERKKIAHQYLSDLFDDFNSLIGGREVAGAEQDEGVRAAIYARNIFRRNLKAKLTNLKEKWLTDTLGGENE